MNRKKSIVAIITLSSVLLVSLFLGKIEENKLIDKNSKDYQEWVDASKNEEEVDTINEQVTTQVTSLDFYSKLIKKEKVKVLIAGDRIALSEGKNSINGIWSEGVSYIINKNYGSEVELKLLASKDITIKGSQDLLSKEDTINQDLIILCFGHNDSVTSVNIQEFKSTYNKIVTDIKSKNENQNIFLMIPSTLDNTDKYREAIIDVANQNGLVCVDTKATLDNSGLSKKSILNGKLPNDIGYQLYTESISKVINEEAQKRNG